MTKRKKVIQGGTSAGKTYAIIPVLIDKAIKNERIKITVVAETIPAVKDGAVDIFKSVMFDTGRWIESNWIGNPMEYTFSNGSRIQFKAFDTVGKAKSSGKRDILFINEANHVSYDIADALMIRSKETYLDYNPDNEFWAHTEVLREPNSEFLTLTYLDNEAAPPETIEDLLIKKLKAFHNATLNDSELFKESNIKSDYWVNWWRVYGLGMTGSLEGIIYHNWDQIDNVPENADLIGYGLDWGFSGDPLTLVALYKCEGTIIVDELIYKTGLTNNALISEMRVLGIKTIIPIIADSSEPKSISDLRIAGFDCRPAYKMKDHKSYAIKQILTFDKWHVTSRSLNAIKELRSYKWAKSREGLELNKPEDGNDHAMDALIYVVNEILNLGAKSDSPVVPPNKYHRPFVKLKGISTYL